MEEVENSSRTSALWAQVKETLLGRVRDGRYPVGSFLPREVDLADELHVSRNTVREAIRQLTNEGILRRRKRLGTRVISDGSLSGLSLNLDPRMLQGVLGTTSEIKVIGRELVPFPSDLGELWNEGEGDTWLRVEYLRVSNETATPLSWSQLFLSPDLAEIGELIGERPGHFFRMIEEVRHEQMTRTRTQITPVLLGERASELLGLPENDLSLKVSHAILNDRGACHEMVISVYPARYYKFDISFDLRE